MKVIEMQKILVIEDDQALSQLICKRLNDYGFHAVEIDRFYHASEEFNNLLPDLVLLDINLPYEDGYVLCKKIRAISNVPILMISARTEEIEQIMAIELGADDYIVKPFTMNMLIVKVKALLRRVHNSFPVSDEVIRFHDLQLNLHTMGIQFLEKYEDVSKNEALLLQCLMHAGEHYCSKDTLIDHVWGQGAYIEENTLSTNIAKLRKHLANIHPSFHIETKRGVGYRLVKKGVS